MNFVNEDKERTDLLIRDCLKDLILLAANSPMRKSLFIAIPTYRYHTIILDELDRMDIYLNKKVNRVHGYIEFENKTRITWFSMRRSAIDPHYNKLAGHRFETSDYGFVYDYDNCDPIGLEYLSNRIRHFDGFQKAI